MTLSLQSPTLPAIATRAAAILALCLRAVVGHAQSSLALMLASAAAWAQSDI